MKELLLKCALDRCNIDGTKDMSLQKCVFENGSPCYHLIVKTNDENPKNDAWNKFNDFVNKKHDK